MELGIAIALARNNNNIAIYLIKEKKSTENLLHNIPSDLLGYFISQYTLNVKGEATFHDNNSLRMSIESDVKEFYENIIQLFQNTNVIIQ